MAPTFTSAFIFAHATRYAPALLSSSSLSQKASTSMSMAVSMKRTEPYPSVAGHSKTQSQGNGVSVREHGLGLGCGMGIQIRGGIFVSIHVRTRWWRWCIQSLRPFCCRFFPSPNPSWTAPYMPTPTQPLDLALVGNLVLAALEKTHADVEGKREDADGMECVGWDTNVERQSGLGVDEAWWDVAILAWWCGCGAVSCSACASAVGAATDGLKCLVVHMTTMKTPLMKKAELVGSCAPMPRVWVRDMGWPQDGELRCNYYYHRWWCIVEHWWRCQQVRRPQCEWKRREPDVIIKG